MKLVNLNGPQDVMALLVRRKWWIVLPFIALSAGVVLITIMLPQLFVSQNLVVIQARSISDDLVKNLIVGSTAERLSVITERVLSAKNLKKILETPIPALDAKISGLDIEKTKTFGDLQDFQGLYPMEKIVKLRKQLDVQFSAGEQLKKGQLPVTAFRVVGRNRDAYMASKIVDMVTDVFINEDTDTRQANVNDTAAFLQVEVKVLADKLAESDKRLKELKSRRRDELPNQLESNLRRLENLTADNQARRRDLQAYVLARSQQEQQMSETPKRIPKPSAASLQVTPPDQDVETYRKYQTYVKNLATQGRTDAHPDVIAGKLTLQRLEDNLTEEQKALAKKLDIPPSAGLTPPTEDPDAMENNPLYMSMERNLERMKKQIEIYEEQIAQNEAAIKTYNQHVNNVPEGEQELAEVLRENNDLNRQYYELKSKLAAANLSLSAETDEKGASFVVVDPGSVPNKPTKPSKPLIVTSGLILSLLIALGIGFVVDIANQKTWTQSDVASLLGVKVLVEVPRIVTRNGVARSQKKTVGFMASVGVASVAYAFCLYVAYSHPVFVLRSLDPLIQKFY